MSSKMGRMPAPSARASVVSTWSPRWVASGSTVCTQRRYGLETTCSTSRSLNTSTSASAWRRPGLERGRSRSSPSHSSRAPALAWRTRYSGTSEGRQDAEELAVAFVGEDLHRLGHPHPAKLVHLGAGLELAVRDGLHQPVADHLVAAAPVDVRGAAHLPHQLAAEPRLLFGLAQRRVLRRLIAVELALGKRPIVIGGTVNDRQLQETPPAVPVDQPPGCADHSGIGHVQDLCFHDHPFAADVVRTRTSPIPVGLRLRIYLRMEPCGFLSSNRANGSSLGGLRTVPRRPEHAAGDFPVASAGGALSVRRSVPWVVARASRNTPTPTPPRKGEGESVTRSSRSEADAGRARPMPRARPYVPPPRWPAPWHRAHRPRRPAEVPRPPAPTSGH